MLQTISIIVKGRVQGVYFRQTSMEKAISLGITGEVCNTPNRNVKILATGTREKLDQFIAWCRQGPSRAEVSELLIADEPLQNFEGFKIVR